MPASTREKKARRSALTRFGGRKRPQLYRPSGSFPFPEVRGKTVADVYVTAQKDRSCVTLRFDDNTELVIEIESYFSVTADYSDWKTGNARLVKNWPRV